MSGHTEYCDAKNGWYDKIMNERKIGVSFKMDPTVLRKLNEEVNKTEVSLNYLINQICRHHVDWHSRAVEGGTITILKPMFLYLLNQINENQIREIARKIAKKEGKEFIMTLSKEYNVNAVLRLVETWLKIAKHPYSSDKDDTKHRFLIAHNMGKKYSIYLAAFYEQVFEDLKISKTKFLLSENTISFMINTIELGSQTVTH